VSGASDLENFIAGVEKLQAMNADVARAAEKPVADVARKSASAGKAPDGSPWAPKADGGRALTGAADAIKSSTKGNQIKLTVGTPHAFHNAGAGGTSQTKEAKRMRARTRKRQAETGKKSKFHAPKRQILPASGEPIPSAMNEAIEQSARKVFARAMGGR
jgi:hypothetical protein